MSRSYSRKPSAPIQPSPKKRIGATAPLTMPAENDAQEQRQTEEERDCSEKTSEAHRAAFLQSERERHAKLDEHIMQRFSALTTSMDSVIRELQQLRADLHSLLVDSRAHLEQQITEDGTNEKQLLESLWEQSTQREVLYRHEEIIERNGFGIEEQSHVIDGLSKQRKMATKILKSRLKALLIHDDHYKQNGVHKDHRYRCAQVADGAVSIAHFLTRARLQNMELDRLKTGAWQPVSAMTDTKLSVNDAARWHHMDALLSDHEGLVNDRTAKLFRRLSELYHEFNPHGEDANTAIASLSHPIRAIGHEIRAVEFVCTSYHIFPGLAFSRTWATLHLTQYCSFWQLSLDDLKCWTRIEKAHRYRGGYLNVVRQAQQFAYRVQDILLDYKHLLNEGDTLLCPHRHPEFHEWHCKTFTSLQKNRFDYLDLQALVNAQIEELRHNTIHGSKSFIKARSELLSTLADSVKPQLEWRRGYRQWSEKLMATLSVGYLLDGEPIASHNPAITPLKIFAHSERHRKAKRDLMQWRPQAWFQRDLLPSPSNVPVDYIASAQSLYAVLPELYDSKVLGLDIVRAPGTGNPSQKTEYVLLANEKQIVIIDFQAIDSPHLLDAIEILRFILENEHILKVGFQSHIDMMFLWQLNIINMNSYYPLPFSSLELFSGLSIPDKINLAALKALQANNPQVYFYHLACRPYAALRAFHASVKHDIVRSYARGNWFDVSSARTKLDEEISNGRTDPTLGPVTIDRMSRHAFGRKQTSTRPFTTKTRGSWLKAMSLQMASRMLTRPMTERRLDLPPWGSMDNDSKEQCQQALAAYFMAAVFNEDLQTIVHTLDIVPKSGPQYSRGTSLARCAAWILWAAKVAHLPINPNDRAMLLHRSQGMEIEDSIGR